MSSLNALMKVYCPNGVDYVDLGDVIQLKKGKQLNKELLSADSKYPAYNGGISYSGFTNDYNYNENTIIISQGGASAGFVNFVTTKFYANAHCYVILPKHEIVINRYLYHFLKLNQDKLTSKQHGAGIPALRTTEILGIRIPIPPLPVQEEIVKILDKFTSLTAELEAELEARSRQYVYYRDELLSFENTPVEWKTLGELYDFKNGLNKGKEFFGRGNPIVNFTDVFKNRWLTSSKLKGKVELDEVEIQRYSAKSNDLFFTRTSEVRDEIGKASVLLEDIDNCVFSGFVLRARPKTNLLNPKFISYYLTIYNVREEIIRHSSFTTRGLTSGPKLSKIKIPVPARAEQERIVAILDKFDALVNDISTGLPAEIKARREQYEYYRNKLLTFN